MITNEKLFAYGKFITETELQKISKEGDYQLFYCMIEKMVESGLLKPVKASGSNGRIPPLYNKYRIIRPREDYAEYMKAIRRLNPRLNIPAYLQRPELYKKHIEIVEGLNLYLWYQVELLDKPMSRKERSFSIWGREKLLDQQYSLVREVLKFNGLDEGFLNFYDTPEPFFEYVHSHSREMTALILENKDTWFSFRKLMQATGKSRIAGTEVNLLLYGEGNKITKKAALTDYVQGMLRGQVGQTIRFLYFGDLDREGIRLFFRTREANPGLSIQPFAPLYQLMLKLAEGREMPESQDKRDIPVDTEQFARLLGNEEADAIRRLWDHDRYIPQEIINYQVLSDIMS